MKNKILLFLISTILILPVQSKAQYADAIVASVDGIPITLSDLSKKVNRKLNLKEVSTDSDAKLALDELINDKLLRVEAEQKRVGTNEEEVDSYINEVAKQNSMSKEDFIAALAKENKTLAEYKKTIETEIIKSKLASSYLKTNVAVTEEEVDQYAKANGLLLDKEPPRVKLKQILLSKTVNSPEKVALLRAEIKEKLDDGEDFSELAIQYSQSPEGLEGGDIGEIKVTDLDKQVFEAVSALNEGETSNFIENENSVRIFYLEEKIEPKEEDKPKLDEATKDNIRKTLEAEKYQTESASFFNKKLYENHAVDKKI